MDSAIGTLSGWIASREDNPITLSRNSEVNLRKMGKRKIIHVTPIKLIRKWARAALLAVEFPINAARFAVMVVPIFAPNTIEAASPNGSHPSLASTRVNAMAALDDCTSMVNSIPRMTNNKIESNPKSV
jgi:hypothetical protein